MMHRESGREQAMALLAITDQQRPGVRRLARAVSLAVRIDFSLLRRARLRLTPDLDAGVESDLWFSWLVSSRSAGAIVLRRNVAHVLREELAESAEQLEAAHRLIRDAPGRTSPEILLEEKVIFLGTRGGDGVDDELTECLKPALKTLVEDPERGQEVARWADRAIGGLPPAAKKNEAVRLLAFGAAARLGPSAQIRGELAAMQLPGGVAWVVPGGAGTGDLVLTVRLHQDRIDFVQGDDGSLNKMTVPAALPLVEICWREDGEERTRLLTVSSGGSAVLPPGIGEVLLRTPTAGEFVLTPSLASYGKAGESRKHEPVEWVLQVLQPLALAFHTGALEGEDGHLSSKDLRDFYGFRTEEELNDFLHVRQVCAEIFGAPVTGFLAAGEDPFHDPNERKLHDFHELVDSAEAAVSDEALEALGEMLFQVRWFATEADAEVISELLGQDLDAAWRALRGGMEPARWRAQQADLGKDLHTLFKRLRHPDLVKIAIRYTNAFQRSFHAFPNTLMRSADFPRYLDQVARLWEVYAGEAERRLGRVTLEIRHPIPHSAFEEFAGRFPWVLTPGESSWVESRSEEGYTAWLSLQKYREVIRDLYEPLRTRLYQVVRERAGRSP